jgi:hypothetical protein
MTVILVANTGIATDPAPVLLALFNGGYRGTPDRPPTYHSQGTTARKHKHIPPNHNHRRCARIAA